MKHTSIVLVLVLTSFFAKGQAYSLTIDSLTTGYMKNLTKEQAVVFTRILNMQKAVHISQRTDTVNFDYAFLEASFATNDSVPQITERYFINENRELTDYGKMIYGVLPKLCYYNGSAVPVSPQYFSSSIAGTHYSNMIDYYYTLDTLKANYAVMQPVQQLMYDKTQVVEYKNDSSAAMKSKMAKAIVSQLKLTYSVVTIIDRTAETVRVSLQLPPANPKVTVDLISYTHYDW